MSSLLARFSQYNLAHPVLYTFITLSCVWTFGGGDENNFYTRVYPGSAFLWVFIYLFHLAHQKFGERLTKEPMDVIGKFPLNFDVKTFSKIIPLAILFSALTVFFVLFTEHSLGWQLSYNYFSNLPFAVLLGAAILFHGALEILFRGVFSPAWGYGNAAFLEAAMWASCTQKIGPMLIIWIVGLGLARISINWGVKHAFYCRILWALITLTTLKLL